MAINQEATSRTIDLPTTRVSAGTGLLALSQATGQIGQLITDKLTNVAIDKAATQGELDVEAGVAPQNLTMGFTKATQAYNEAVTRTEYNRMALTSSELINKALIEAKDPAKFNSKSPLQLESSLNGIKEGILQNARPEVRAKLAQHIDQMASNATINMLQHSITYDNQQAQKNFNQDLSTYLEERTNAAVAGNAQRVAAIDELINSTISDYSTMNQEISNAAPEILKKIEKQRAIDGVMGDFSQAIETNSTAQYMKDLADNKQNLPFNVWQDAVKAVVSLDQKHNALVNDINAQEVQQVSNAINKGLINDPDDVLNMPNLTTTQKLKAINDLETKQAKDFTSGSKLLNAQNNILTNQPEMNTPSDRNKLYGAAIQNYQQATGQVPSLQEKSKMILGQSNFPASGLPDTPLGRNVPVFDDALSGQLTSKNPLQTALAASIYKDMVSTQNQPNSVNITGDALAVASLYNTLIEGDTSPELAASQAIDVVLNAKEPEIAQRIERYHRIYEHVDPSTKEKQTSVMYKDIFGTKPKAFNNDEAYNLFQTLFRANYLTSNSEQAAIDATKYQMRAWGTSKYFDNGFVGNPVPEIEIPITKIGNSFDNQIASRIQGLINTTNSVRSNHPDLNIPSIEWANPQSTITGEESDEEKVFSNFAKADKPRIKINGVETDVVLIPTQSSRLGKGVNYILGAYDQFNNLHPIRDVTNNVDQVARFAPQDLSLWAPKIATKEMDKRMNEIASRVNDKILKSQDTKELAELEKKNPAALSILGLGGMDEYRQYIKKRAERTDKGTLENIVSELNKNVNAQITDADHVGIAAENGQ
jgi:hypothetical protein